MQGDKRPAIGCRRGLVESVNNCQYIQAEVCERYPESPAVSPRNVKPQYLRSFFPAFREYTALGLSMTLRPFQTSVNDGKLQSSLPLILRSHNFRHGSPAFHSTAKSEVESTMDSITLASKFLHRHNLEVEWCAGCFGRVHSRQRKKLLEVTSYRCQLNRPASFPQDQRKKESSWIPYRTVTLPSSCRISGIQADTEGL